MGLQRLSSPALLWEPWARGRGEGHRHTRVDTWQRSPEGATNATRRPQPSHLPPAGSCFQGEQEQLGADSDFMPLQTHNSGLRLEDSRKAVEDMQVPHIPCSPSCFSLPTWQPEAKRRERRTRAGKVHASGCRWAPDTPYPACHRSLGSVREPLAMAGQTCGLPHHMLGPELASPRTGCTLGR